MDKKSTEYEEEKSIFAILLMNYCIFLLVLFILTFPLNLIALAISDEANIHTKASGIFLVQNILIIIFVWIGFSFGWNEVIKKSHFNGWVIAVNAVFLLIASIHFLCIYKDSDDDNPCLLTYHILYIPMMIIFYYLFSTIINEKHILSFIFIIFIELFLSLIFMALSKSENYWIIAAISILSGILSSILFHFCWFKNTKAFIWIIVFSILIGIYLTIISAGIDEYYNKNKIFYSVMAINYSIFSLGIFVIEKIFYYLYKCLKCTKEGCDEY